MDKSTIYNMLTKFKATKVYFPQYNVAYSILLNAIEDTEITGEPYGAVIAGYTGAGKTTLCLHAKDKYKRRYSEVSEQGLHYRDTVVYFEVPDTVTVKGLVAAMLVDLGISNPAGSKEQMTGQLIRLLQERKVKLVFLDEIQKLCYRSADKVRIDALGWIVSFVNRIGITVILSGTEECLRIRSYLPAFATRFPYQINLEFFHFSQNADSDYRRTLQKLDESLNEITGLKPEAHLHDPSVAAALFIATSGNLGGLRRIIHVALKRVLTRDDGNGLKWADFFYACDQVKWHTGLKSENPFFSDLTGSLEFLASAEARVRLQNYSLQQLPN